MLDDDIYNRVCEIFFLEEVRRKDCVSALQNLIAKTGTSDPVVYLKLAQAQACADFFDYFSGSFLEWLGSFI